MSKPRVKLEAMKSRPRRALRALVRSPGGRGWSLRLCCTAIIALPLLYVAGYETGPAVIGGVGWALALALSIWEPWK